MKKLIALLLIILVGTGVYLGLRHRREAGSPVAENPTESSTTPTTSTTTPITPSEATTLKFAAWNVFQKYLMAAKSYDLPTIKALSYQISSACQTLTDECKNRLATIYNLSNDFVLSDFTHITYDSKQLIMYTDYTEFLGDAPQRMRAIMYFVREGDALKMLYINPFQGSFTIRGSQSTSTIEAYLNDITKDSDGDTTPDSIEMCADTTAGANCVKTDPDKKDTNGNGWWDSIESLFYKS